MAATFLARNGRFIPFNIIRTESIPCVHGILNSVLQQNIPETGICLPCEVSWPHAPREDFRCFDTCRSGEITRLRIAVAMNVILVEFSRPSITHPTALEESS
jgi:hypothetical protein